MYDTAWEAEVGIDMSISVDDERGNEGVDDDGEEDGWIRYSVRFIYGTYVHHVQY
jgi:hypothetical protein